MKGFHGNIEALTLENTAFRKVLYTQKHAQLVLMSLRIGEDIGEETHPATEQFFRFESGTGKAYIDGNEYTLDAGTALIVPAGAKHNIINTSTSEWLKMYTLYSPAHHLDGIIRNTKAEAQASAPEFDGVTTE